MQHPLVDSRPARDVLSLSGQSSFVSVALQTAGSMFEHLPGALQDRITWLEKQEASPGIIVLIRLYVLPSPP